MLIYKKTLIILMADLVLIKTAQQTSGMYGRIYPIMRLVILILLDFIRQLHSIVIKICMMLFIQCMKDIVNL
jgi:hypothetical protein